MFLGIFFAALAASGATQWKVECGVLGGEVEARYCIHRPTGSSNADVLFYLHGAGGSHQTWNETAYYPQQLREQWDARGAQAPTVVSVSYGPVWLLAAANTSARSGLLARFTQKTLPLLERLLDGVRGRRLLLGESMGGFNSLQLGLKTELFEKVAALCAPVSSVNPFATEKEIEAFIQSSRAWSYFHDSNNNIVRNSVHRSIQIAQMFFPTLEDWSGADPLLLATREYRRTSFYLAVGFYDPYAAYEGNLKLSQALQANGYSVQWRPQWGGHCAIDIPSLADWIVP